MILVIIRDSCLMCTSAVLGVCAPPSCRPESGISQRFSRSEVPKLTLLSMLSCPAFCPINCFSITQRTSVPRMSSRDTMFAVKVCGVASVEDAILIGNLARKELPPSFDLLLGMILWPRSKRSVRYSVAKDIAKAAKSFDMKPVAVFVDESRDDILRCCDQCDIQVAQLHGEKSRKSVAANNFPSSLAWIDVVDVSSANPKTDGAQRDMLDPTSGPIWTIYDAPGGGTGKPFDWKSFTPPNTPWLLAGGLDPDNVSTAISLLRPTGVDVASGVTKADKVRKDEDKLRLFFQNIAGAQVRRHEV